MKDTKTLIIQDKKIQTKYKVNITWLKGWRTFNELWRRCDMNSEGVYVEDGVTFYTTSKPTKRMVEKYKKAILDANKFYQSVEIVNIKVNFELMIDENN